MTNPIPSSDLPALPGVSFRPIRGVADADALCAIHHGRQARDQVDPISTLESVPSLEQMQAALSNAVTQQQQDHWLVAQVGEQVVGYNRIVSWRDADGMWVYLSLGWVLPAWRGDVGAGMR